MEKFSESKSSIGNNNLWDCGSTLYDSFELNSFKRQLDSAILNSHRTLSMSRLPECRVVLPLQPLPEKQPKKPFNNIISRSVQKFLRSVFSRSTSNTNSFQVTAEKYSKDRFYVLYDKSGSVLSTIPEGPEFEISAISPEVSSLVRRSASERFTGTTAIGISFA